MAGILLNRSRQVPAEETPAFGGIAERFRRGGDLDRAVALCRDGLKRFPDQLSARVTLGWALLDKGQYDAAREELEYVLRKAPDNLAAIRGLAELHDRTEGALPSDDSSWKSDDASTVDADVSAEPAASVAGHDLLAPIPVSFGHGAAEVVHTAAQAEQDANGVVWPTFESDRADLAGAPIELEDPAAASMAAADPMPFFVVDPDEAIALELAPAADVAPTPFVVAADESVQMALETPGPAALAAADVVSPSGDALDALAVDLETFAAPAPTSPAFAADLETTGAAQTEDLDWAGLTSLTGRMAGSADASWDEASEPLLETAADSHEDAGVLAVDGLDLDFGTALIPALDENGEHVAAVFTAPEGLDDIDELAGQELADAIKALEDASRRVEARLAPAPQRNEPAATPEDIASFDFGAADLDAEGQTDDQPARLDSSHDGAFELVSPDLSDLAFATAESVDLSPHTDPDADIEPVVADAAAPQFDFDAAVESRDAAFAAAPDAADAIGIVADADAEGLVDAAAADEGADAPSRAHDGASGALQASVAELFADLDVIPAGELAAADELVSDAEFDGPQFEAAIDTSPVNEADNVIAWPDAPAASIDVDGSDRADALVTDVDADDTRDAAEQGDDAHGAAEAPLAAMVATDVEDVILETRSLADEQPDVSPVVADTSSAMAAAASGSPVAESLPVVHVYDVPVFTAAHAAAMSELAGLAAPADSAAAVTMGRAETSKATSTVAALERFLRKVQARQLELRGETVA